LPAPVPALLALHSFLPHRTLLPFPTRRSSDLGSRARRRLARDGQHGIRHDRRLDEHALRLGIRLPLRGRWRALPTSKRQPNSQRSEEHTSELQSLAYLVCRLLLEKKKKKQQQT